MKSPIVRPIGIALSLSAWIFGAFLLGMGNAYFGVTGEFGAHTDTADSNQHAHQQFAKYGLHDVDHDQHALHTSSSTGSMGHSVHAGANEPLPTHCLFCLDGLAATSDTTPAVRALFAELSSLHRLAQYRRIFADSYLPRPATRAPPVRSPAH